MSSTEGYCLTPYRYRIVEVVEDSLYAEVLLC